jgi:hypothetical protein
VAKFDGRYLHCDIFPRKELFTANGGESSQGKEEYVGDSLLGFEYQKQANNDDELPSAEEGNESQDNEEGDRSRIATITCEANPSKGQYYECQHYHGGAIVHGRRRWSSKWGKRTWMAYKMNYCPRQK